jgi:hypothetical protein
MLRTIDHDGRRIRELEAEVADLKRQLVEARAEAERVRGLWRNLMKAAGEDQCHMRAMEAIEANAKDAERWNKVERGRLSVCFNQRIREWVVQDAEQVVGNLGRGASARAAIDAAKEPK